MADEHPRSHHPAPKDPAEYYAQFSDSCPGLARNFKDIDQSVHYNEYNRLLSDPTTKNFVVDFGNDDAWCAVNLEKMEIEKLIENDRPKMFGTRWINLWVPEDQTDTIKCLATKYGLSERLQQLMCSKPMSQVSPPFSDPRKSQHPKSTQPRTGSTMSPESEFSEAKGDIEGGIPLKEVDPTQATRGVAAASGKISFAHIVNHIWHFCSVDYGSKYTCIGYNSLYSIELDKKVIENGTNLPDGKRLWSWIILCHDGTIISMQENPFPGPYKPTSEERTAVLKVVRRNIQLIFEGVSKQYDIDTSESLETIRVRRSVNSDPEQANIKPEDGPSLLMYYLFDDWVSSYRLVAQREHKYGATLEGIRGEMLQKPQVALVDDLHWLGRRLAVLKRVYQSYELIITRILQRQRLLREEARLAIERSFVPEPDHIEDHLRHPSARHRTMTANTYYPDRLDQPRGVALSSASVGRFERLVDRIRLYCLSEIETCLTEKESLTFMNFNLIALKDSQAVEKLTRITILLAKVTIVFLPVSLMTGYFSTQVQDLQPTFTARSYWISFAVITVLSITLLSLFSYASDTIEGRTVYRSLSRTIFGSSKSKRATGRR